MPNVISLFKITNMYIYLYVSSIYTSVALKWSFHFYLVSQVL